MIIDRSVHAINLLQEMVRNSGAATYAPNYEAYPANLANIDLPCILTYPGQARGRVKSGWTDSRRKFYIEGFVAKMGTISAREQRAKTARVIDSLADYITRLNDGDSYILDYGDQSGVYVGIDWTQPLEDSGPVTNIDFTGAKDPNDLYFGFQIIIPMQLKWGDKA